MRFENWILPRLRLTSAAILMLLLAVMPANGQEFIDGDNIDGVMRAARLHGSAALASQPDGSPMITGRMDGLPYSIHFRNCQNMRLCQDLNFRIGFLIQPGVDSMNTWNQTKCFTRAYLDTEGDAILEMDVVLAGGISANNMSEVFSYWRLSMKQFRTFIGFD